MNETTIKNDEPTHTVLHVKVDESMLKIIRDNAKKGRRSQAQQVLVYVDAGINHYEKQKQG